MADTRSGKRRRREVMAHERVAVSRNRARGWNQEPVSDEAVAACASSGTAYAAARPTTPRTNERTA